MTRAMQRSTVLGATRESQQTKLQDITMCASLYRGDLKHKQRLSRITPALQIASASLSWLAKASLSVAFIVNLLVLLLYARTDGEGTGSDERNTASHRAILAFGVIQAILSVGVLGIYAVKHYPAIIFSVCAGH